MKWHVIVRPRAEEDSITAWEWYEKQKRGLGDEFLDEIGRVVTKLETGAESTTEYYRGFRRMLTARFPYKLFYRIEGDRVVVFRILHARRDHRRWLAE